MSRRKPQRSNEAYGYSTMYVNYKTKDATCKIVHLDFVHLNYKIVKLNISEADSNF
jgi:hypothetical protein